LTAFSKANLADRGVLPEKDVPTVKWLDDPDIEIMGDVGVE